MKKKFLRQWFLIFLFLGLTPLISTGTTETDSNLENNDLYLVVGELETLSISGLTRVSVSDPQIADVADVETTGLVIIGKAQGQTDVFYWDAQGKNKLAVYVYKQEMDLMQARAERLLKAAGLVQVKVEKNEKEGKIVLSGGIPEYQKDIFSRVTDTLYESVIDLTTPEQIDDLVQIDMQITELTTTLTKELGIDWFTGTQTVDANGNVTTQATEDFNPVYGEVLPNFDGSVEDFFKVGDFFRTTNSALLAKVNALIIEGKGRILSRPKLVVISGKEASFLVGGEIPIRTSTISEGGTTENVTFKNYGIGIVIIPAIRNGKVDISLNMEVSDIDRANKVGDDVAFTTRTAQTQLYLDDKETVVLAGLIRKTDGEVYRKVPYVSQIPILGALFRSKKTPSPNQDQEIVISLTPTILRQRPIVSKTVSNENAKTVPNQTYYNPGAVHYSGIPKEMATYVNDVQRKISSAIQYPPEAESYQWEGTVKLGLLILQDGTLAYASVRESSGYNVFDQYALKTARDMADTFGQFPSDANLQELDITIPIVYSLGNR